MRRWMQVAVLAAGLLLPGGGAALATGGAPPSPAPPAPSAVRWSAVMIEGRVVSVSWPTLAVMTPARGFFCWRPLLCPDVLQAPARYTVEAGGAKLFGDFLGAIPARYLRADDMVVVYGLLSGTATIGAVGIFILSPPLSPLPLPIRQGPASPLRGAPSAPGLPGPEVAPS